MNDAGLIQAIKDGWSSLGVQPVRIVMMNDFGHTIFENEDGTFWRITPEWLTCDCVAQTAAELQDLVATKDFMAEWKMTKFVDAAGNALRGLAAKECYSLMLPAGLGGRYEAQNFEILPRTAVLALAGSMAEQSKDLPEGTRIRSFREID